MSEAFVGEIRMFGGNFAPRNWAFCDGQLLAISQNDALFSLLGTLYGGDGRTTFGLPDLRGRIPIHKGQGPGLTNRNIGAGARGGAEKVTVTPNQLPAHSHTLTATTQGGNESSPNAAQPAQSTIGVYLRNPNPPSVQPLHSDTISNTGGSQSHENVMPFQCVNFVIALFGTYPSRN
jgi:microcystin-dependent protein